MHKLILLALLSLFLRAEMSEERFFKDKNAHAQGFGLHSDVGYSSYLIELDSSELNSAIDYDVLEFTLGGSYAYEQWMWGIYATSVLKELKSNMFVVTTKENLGDQASIDKKEFGVYVNYTFLEQDVSRWSLNAIYRYAKLEAEDSYQDFYVYGSSFDYATEGLALSLAYSFELDEERSGYALVGLLYTKAKVEMEEYVNRQAQDSFVHDDAFALGGKVSVGFSQKIQKQLFLTLRVDAWKLNFGELKVNSRVGDTLPKAKLKEQSFTTYVGVSWRF